MTPRDSDLTYALTYVRHVFFLAVFGIAYLKLVRTGGYPLEMSQKNMLVLIAQYLVVLVTPFIHIALDRGGSTPNTSEETKKYVFFRYLGADAWILWFYLSYALFVALGGKTLLDPSASKTYLFTDKMLVVFGVLYALTFLLSSCLVDSPGFQRRTWIHAAVTAGSTGLLAFLWALEMKPESKLYMLTCALIGTLLGFVFYVFWYWTGIQDVYPETHHALFPPPTRTEVTEV